MTTRELTVAVAKQILFMDKILRPLGLWPKLDWTKRSEYDQYELFKAKASKCDGVIKISAHQIGRAADIYAIGPGPKDKPIIIDVKKEIPGPWAIIRENWVELGGKPALSWDPCHFEG